jgi:hypothetical protein
MKPIFTVLSVFYFTSKAQKHMKEIIFIFSFLLVINLLPAQEVKEPNFKNNQLTGSAGLSTRGIWGDARFRFGENDTKWVIGLDFATLQSMREVRIKSWYMQQRIGTRYVYDKMNRFGVLAPTFGISRDIFPQGYYNKINVRVDASLGPAIGLLRPYYLEVDFGTTISEVKSVPYDPTNVGIYYERIMGETPFYKFLSPKKGAFGLSLRANALIDFSRYKKSMNGVQLSLNVDAFPKAIPIMATQKNTAVFVSGCIGFMFGKRW